MTTNRPRGRPRKVDVVQELPKVSYQYERLVVHLQGDKCENHCRACRYLAVGGPILSISMILRAVRLARGVVLRGSEPMFYPGITGLLSQRDEPDDVLYTHLPWDAFCWLRDRAPMRRKIVMIYHSLEDGGYLQPSVFFDRAWRLRKAGYNVEILSRQNFNTLPMYDGEGYGGRLMEVPVVVEPLPVWDLEEGEARECVPKEVHLAPNGFLYPCEAAMLHDYRSGRGAALGTIKDSSLELTHASCRLEHCQGPRQAGQAPEAA